MDRVIVIDKPSGLTSHDVVQRVRRALAERRVGHAGTLDPSATGVLVVLVGRATRLSQFLTLAEKEYEGEIVLGARTDTQDADGSVISTGDTSGITAGAVSAAFAQLTGEILQLPPMVSALKHEGRPLYELARRGIEVQRKPRPVTIRAFEMLGFELPVVRFHVVCSKGTYVRTLADDVGERLGCGGHLGDLRRTRSGEFTLAEAVRLENLSRPRPGEELPGRSLFEALAEMPVAEISGHSLDQVLEGQPVAPTEPGDAGTLLRMTPDGIHLTAVGRLKRRDGEMVIQPVRVFAEEPDLGGRAP